MSYTSRLRRLMQERRDLEWKLSKVNQQIADRNTWHQGENRAFERDYYPEERAVHWLLSLLERGVAWVVDLLLRPLERYRRRS